MPQPKPTAKRSTPAKRSTASAKPAAKRDTTASAAAKRATATTEPSTSAAAKRGSTTAAKRTPQASRTPRADELVVAALGVVRDNLTRGVVLTGERLQEAVDDSVRRGRMTRDDAEELAESLLAIGRKQSQELLRDLEALINGGRVREAAETARKRAGETATRARRTPVADRALREVDRARRATGLATFPISGYDELTVAQVNSRLADLAPAELRKVRDYERRHANRKSVLNAIEKRLAR
jgi:polyhydroxyalkanoate synthesis regulator phasin